VQKGLWGEQAVSNIIGGGTGAVVTSCPLINYVVPITIDDGGFTPAFYRKRRNGPVKG
jgi:hypothetical protein